MIEPWQVHSAHVLVHGHYLCSISMRYAYGLLLGKPIFFGITCMINMSEEIKISWANYERHIQLIFNLVNWFSSSIHINVCFYNSQAYAIHVGQWPAMNLTYGAISVISQCNAFITIWVRKSCTGLANETRRKTSIFHNHNNGTIQWGSKHLIEPTLKTKSSLLILRLIDWTNWQTKNNSTLLFGIRMEAKRRSG